MDDKILELVTRRRRQLLIHSFLYYQMSENIIDDHTFDAWSKELADLQATYPEESAAAVFADGFRSFDGSSGFDLPFHYPEIQSRALHLLRYHRDKEKSK